MKNPLQFHTIIVKLVLLVFTTFLFLSVSLFSPPRLHAKAAGPGWINATGTAVTPGIAREYYQESGQQTNPESQQAFTVGAAAASPEITELARALQHDPRLIYEYVRNHVDYVPYFGSLKGATLTLLDGSGNDFDQASLLIALLRESGFAAQYVYGSMWIPAFGAPDQKDMQHWLGVDPNYDAISTVLGNGGIPWIQSYSYYEISRVWVKLFIDGAAYFIDPAFKVYSQTQGIDLASAMGYNSSALLSAAGGTVGTDSIENMNETGLKTALDTYSTNLYNTLRTTYPNAAMEDIVGGRKIIPEYLPELPNAIPFTNFNQSCWDQIPLNFVHTVNIRHGEINETLNIADLSGGRLSLTYRAAAGEASQEAAPLFKTEVRQNSMPKRLAPRTVNAAGISGSSPLKVPDRQMAGPRISNQTSMDNETSQGSWDFGKIYPTGYSEGSMTVTNPNSVTIKLVVSLSSNPTSAFTIVSGGGTHNVGTGANHSIRVRLNGTGQTPGTKTGQLKIEWWYGTNNFHTDYSDLTGVVARPIAIDGYGLNVTTYLNQPYTGTCRLENKGTLPLTLSSMSISGTHASRFQFVDGNGSGTIPAGGYRDIRIRYLADVHGSHSASIAMSLIYDDMPYTGDTVSLQGSTYYPPNLDGSYGTNFGQVYLSNPREGTCRVLNNGSLALTLSQIRLTGPDAFRFELTGGTGTGSLAPGQYRDIQVRYRADVLGSHSASVNVEFTYDNLSSDITLPLAGESLAAPVAQLWLDDTLIAEETDPVSGQNLDKLFLSIDHPYAGQGGSFADQSVEYTLKRGSYYAIVYDFSGSRDGRLLETRQKKMKAYRQTGFSDTSREVVTETLNVMGMTWMRDTTLDQDLLDKISGMLCVYHHRFGVTAQESGYYIDVKAQFTSSSSRHNDEEAVKANFKAGNHMKSAFEHGVLEQMQVDRPSVSTVKLLQITNNEDGKIFKAVSNNFAAVKPQLFNYSAEDLQTLQESVNKGNTLILPANGKISLQQWAGKGYIEFKTGEYPDMSCGMIIGGDHYGGYGAFKIPVSIPQVNQEIVIKSLPQATTPKIGSRDPVDMASGYFMTNNTDLALTGGTGGLSFKRFYFGGNHHINSDLGYGWSHNYNLYAEVHSTSEMGLGTRLPTDAVAMIVASAATLDLMRGDSGLKEWMTAALIAKWGMDNLTDNAVSLHLESDVLTYVRLPDGTFTLPPGVNAGLVLDTGQYSLMDRFDKTVRFNTDNKAASLTDADGNTTSFTYSSGRLQKVMDNFGHSLTLGYTGDHLTSVTDSAGRTVAYAYTGNTLSAYTDPEQKTWAYGYDNEHRLLTLENPEHITTVTNTYDSLGRVESQTVPRQTGMTSYNLYFAGYRNVEEDSLGNQSVYHYDGKKRLIARENALGHKTVNTYDGQNHVISSTDPLDHTTVFEYDKNNNRVKTVNALGQETVNTYDARFRLTGVTDPLDHATVFEYDVRHHRVKTTIRPTPAEAIETENTYYPNGLARTAKNGRDVVTTFTYDSHGNPDTIQTASEPPIDYDYDLAGRMTRLTDQKGAMTDFSHDGRNLLLTRTDALLKTMTITYYNDGKVHTRTDRNNDTITYTYTPTGKTDTITGPGTATSFIYDTRDNLVQMQDDSGITTYAYDEINRLISKTDPHGFTLSYAYDKAGNLTRLTYPGNKTVTYTYDALNRISTVTDWMSRTATYNYDDAGRLTTLTQFNGTLVQYTLDDADRLTGLKHLTAQGGKAIAAYAFTLDNTGNRTRISQEVPLEITPGSMSAVYTYNNAGNRLLSNGSAAFAYDDEGQLISAYGSALTFDPEHRLTAMTGSQNLQYTYDGSANRLEAVRNGVITRYIYDASGNLLAEADATNQIQRYYIYGTGLLALITPADALYAYHFDGTGHTIALTDAGKTIINAYAYTPFGTITGKQETIPQPFTYAGQYGVMTEPNGWYYMRARYYDPGIGRFISEDPMGFDGGDVNLYGYAGNNPLMGVDPEGLWTTSIGVYVNAALGLGGGGGTTLNFGYSEQDGFSFSLTGTAQGGAVAGTGASVGLGFSYTDANTVNQLNGTSYIAGRSGIGPITAEGIKGSDYTGGTVTFNFGKFIGYTASSVSASTTTALYQYSNGVQSIGNTGNNSIWSSKGK